jgi:hypothetical protein
MVELLERSTRVQAPPVDPVFAEQLERRLRNLDLGAAPRRRRLGRGASTGVIAALLVAGVAAAAAGVATLQKTDEPATTTSLVLVTTTTAAPTTTPAMSTTIVEITSTSAAAVVPTPPPVLAPGPATTVAESTTTITPETTTMVVATTSTEVRTPATLALSCQTDGATVTCTWSAGPDGTTHYALLRSEGPGTNGRAFVVDASTTSYVDVSAIPGTTYSYLVHALDAGEQSLGHSDHVDVPCC